MRTTLEVGSVAKDVFGGMIKRDELLGLMKLLDQEGNPLEVTQRGRKLPPAEVKERAGRTRQSKATLALLRRYFVMRIAQSRGGSAREVF